MEADAIAGLPSSLKKNHGEQGTEFLRTGKKQMQCPFSQGTTDCSNQPQSQADYVTNAHGSHVQTPWIYQGETMPDQPACLL